MHIVHLLDNNDVVQIKWLHVLYRRSRPFQPAFVFDITLTRLSLLCTAASALRHISSSHYAYRVIIHWHKVLHYRLNACMRFANCVDRSASSPRYTLVSRVACPLPRNGPYCQRQRWASLPPRISRHEPHTPHSKFVTTVTIVGNTFVPHDVTHLERWGPRWTTLVSLLQIATSRVKPNVESIKDSGDMVERPTSSYIPQSHISRKQSKRV